LNLRHPPELELGGAGGGAWSCASPGKVPTSERIRTEAAVAVNRGFVFVIIVPLKKILVHLGCQR
jgi:hypothetical protein